MRKTTEERAKRLLDRALTAIGQDPRGEQGRSARSAGGPEAWRKPLADGSRALGPCNRTGAAAAIERRAIDAALRKFSELRDPWRDEELPLSTTYVAVPTHGVVLPRAEGT